MRDPILNAFTMQKCIARKRGIAWQLTFDEWWDIWQQSGHWNDRGRKLNQYCMSRYGDVGPYSTTNVFIQTHIQNSKDANIGHHRNLGITLPRHNCPHCGKEGDMGNLKRWHFENCKQKSPN
jgi:hypothetical protein